MSRGTSPSASAQELSRLLPLASVLIDRDEHGDCWSRHVLLVRTEPERGVWLKQTSDRVPLDGYTTASQAELLCPSPAQDAPVIMAVEGDVVATAAADDGTIHLRPTGTLHIVDASTVTEAFRVRVTIHDEASLTLAGGWLNDAYFHFSDIEYEATARTVSMIFRREVYDLRWWRRRWHIFRFARVPRAGCRLQFRRIERAVIEPQESLSFDSMFNEWKTSPIDSGCKLQFELITPGNIALQLTAIDGTLEDIEPIRLDQTE